MPRCLIFPCIIHTKWRARSSHLFLPLFLNSLLPLTARRIRCRGLDLISCSRLGCNWTVSSWPPFLSFLILFQWPRGRMLIPSPALVSWIPFLYQTLWVILCGSVTAVLFVLSSNLFLAFRTTKKPIVPSSSLPLVIRSLTNTKSTLQWDCLKAKRRTKEGSRRSIQIKHTQREKRN